MKEDGETAWGELPVCAHGEYRWQHTLSCPRGLHSNSYVLSPHALSLIPQVPEFANGVPGLSPQAMAFSPKCVDDVMRKRDIGALRKGIDMIFQVAASGEHGGRLCAGIDRDKEIDGREARFLQLLLTSSQGDTSRSTANLNFDRLFGEAVDQLSKYGRVVSMFTISNLIGLFSYHRTEYPSQHNKGKLIGIFIAQIKANGRKLRWERLETQETTASEGGTVDGATGVPIPQPSFTGQDVRVSFMHLSSLWKCVPDVGHLLVSISAPPSYPGSRVPMPECVRAFEHTGS